MDPTSYRLQTSKRRSSTKGISLLIGRKKPANQNTNISVRRKRSHTPSDDIIFEPQRVYPLEKKARRVCWTDNLKTKLLQGRLQLYHIFEHDNENNVQLAWDKIAAMVDTTCTGEDCLQMFDSLVKTYLEKQQTAFKDVSAQSTEWEHYQILEKLFLCSPRLAGFYDVVELTLIREESNHETSEITDDVLLELSKYNASFAKYCDLMKKFKQRQKKQEDRIIQVVNDLLLIKQENMTVVSEFLKKILYNFNKLDELAKRESLEAITSIFPGIFSMSSTAIAIVTNYLQSSSRENQLIEATNVYFLTFFRLVHHLVDTSDEEEAFYLRSIPYHEQYFEKRASPERLTNQSSMSDFDFKGHLHVSRSSMEGLIAKIGDRFRKPNNAKLAESSKFINLNSNQTYISIERQTLVFMWYLTHNETYEQVALRFAVPLSEVLVILRYFIELITESQLDFINFPHGNLDKKEAVSEFESMRTDAFPGVIGAIGTKYLTVKTPVWFRSKPGGVSKDETIKQLIAVQAIANSKHIFNDVHTAWIELSYSNLKPVTTEETKGVTRYRTEDVFIKSPFHVMYCAGRYKQDTHVVADESYPLMESVMVPYGKPQAEFPSMTLFNQQLHQTRSVIEVAFGKLLSRFCRLRHMDHTLGCSEGLIKTCICLHNFCLKSGDDFSAREIKLPEFEVIRREEVDAAAIAKRDNICLAMNSGKIRYVYRDAEPNEPSVVEKPVAQEALQAVSQPVTQLVEEEPVSEPIMDASDD